MKTLFKSRFNTRTRLSSNIVTMFSLSKERSLLRVLTKYAWKVISISTGKTKVAPRLRRFNKFVVILLKFYKNHGASTTIKWLKACHLSVQRKLSNQPCKTLRDIDPSLPLPRLINGLPTFIGTMDRAAIRNNHAATIRLWLSILSIFRILKGPLNPKLETITDGYKGDKNVINTFLSEIPRVFVENKRLFSNLPSLSASNIVHSLSAGPNCPVAFQSILTDAVGLAKYPEVYEPFRKYSLLTKSSLIFKLDSVIEWLYTKIESSGTAFLKKPLERVLPEFELKGTIEENRFNAICLGKLSFKEEAAGKLRIFAIADIWTQSLFKPLHEALFTFLKRLPNDGTFDQDASFERCLKKAVSYNCAFSVDLSSATDRLPILLQSGIIDQMFNIPGLGECWKSILIDRPYMIRNNKYGIGFSENNYVYYGTGQPMGALSSWAMLATTHHFLLQVSAKRAYPTITGWYDRYEILGDDLVIFDKSVYLEYLRLMDLLNVGTNPSKSLYSETLSALEFAKRTGVEGVDVSGISWKQFIADDSMMGRINLLIHFSRRGLTPTIPIILTILGKSKGDNSISGFLSSRKGTTDLDQSLMALLGHFTNEGKISLIDAVAFTIDPQDEDMENLDKPSLPTIMTLHEILSLLNMRPTDTWEATRISSFDDRRDVAKSEVVGYMADSIVRDSLSKALMLCNNYDLLLDAFALSLVDSSLTISKEINHPFRIVDEGLKSGFSQIEIAQLRSFAEMFMLDDKDPQDLHDSIYDFLMKCRELPTMKEADHISKELEEWEARFKCSSNSKAMTKSTVSWLHKDIMRAGQLNVTPYWRLLS